MHIVIFKKKYIHTHLHFFKRGSSLCNKRHTWPLTLHFVSHGYIFHRLCHMACVSSSWQRTPGENEVSSCRVEDACWCEASSKALKCPVDQQPSRPCLNAILSPRQPEATLKNLLCRAEKVSRDIIWLRASSHNMWVCSLQSHDYRCPLYTFSFFHAVKPGA